MGRGKAAASGERAVLLGERRLARPLVIAVTTVGRLGPIARVLVVVAALISSQLAWPYVPIANAASCTVTDLVPQLQNPATDFMVNQGVGSYPRLTRGKETLVRVFTTLPPSSTQACTPTKTQSISILGATLTVNDSVTTFPPISAYQTFSATKPPKLGPPPAAFNSPADPIFVVPESQLRPASVAGPFTATFTATLSYSAADGTATKPCTTSPCTATFTTTAIVEQKTNALRLLLVPMGNPTLAWNTQFTTSGQAAAQNAMATLSRIYPVPSGVSPLVPTSSTAAVSATTTATVTPRSMAGISVGSKLQIDPGTTQEEVVLVTGVTSTSFTAFFQKFHATGYGIAGVGGIRYVINLAAMVDVSGLLGYTPPPTIPNGSLCGSQLNWDGVKGQLAQFLSAWNTANPSATADRVVGVIDASISGDPTSGCAGGMASVISPESWFRAIPDTSTTPSPSGAIESMEVNHNSGRTNTSTFHSGNVQADGTMPGRAYDVSGRRWLQYNHTVMNANNTPNAWDNTDTLLERDDFGFLLCSLGGTLQAGCSISGTAGTATGVAAGSTLVFAGRTDNTAAGTQAFSYYTNDVAHITQQDPTSAYRLVQIVASTGVILNDFGVPVSFIDEVHGCPVAGCPNPLVDQSITTNIGVFVVAVDGFLGGGTPATRIQFRRLDPALGFVVLWSADQQTSPPSVSLDIGATPVAAPGGSVKFPDEVIATPTIPPKPDVVFLTDTTGSMGSVLANVKTNATSIMNTVRAAQADSQFGAASYKDLACEGDVPYSVDQPLSASISAVQTGINTWTAVGGCDLPEGQLFALQEIAAPTTRTDGGTSFNVNWRAGSNRILVWTGDYPGHDPVCTGVIPTGFGVSANITESTATAALISTGVRVIAVSVNSGTTAFPSPGLDGDPTAGATGYTSCGTPGGTASQGTRIANATSGVFKSAASASDVATAITSGLTNLPATVEKQATCDPGLSVTFTPGATRTVTSGTNATFGQTVNVASNATTGTKSCTVTVKINGVAQTSLTHTITVLVGHVTATATVTSPAAGTSTLTFDLFLQCDSNGPLYPVAAGVRPTTTSAGASTFTVLFDPIRPCGGSDGTAKLIGFASDGFSRSVPGAASAQKTVNSSLKPPVASIYAPGAGRKYARDATLPFNGSGFDPEEGPLTGASLQWTLISGLDGSTLVTASGSSFDATAPAAGWPVSTTVTATHTLKLRAMDSTGAFGEDTRLITIIDDPVPPALSVTHPDNPPGSGQNLNQPVTVTVNASDSASGLEAVTCKVDGVDRVLPNPNGTKASYSASFTVSGYGKHPVVCAATDGVGNTADPSNTPTASDLVWIVYTFNGFFQPIANLPTVNTGKLGRTYPVKWQLIGSDGAVVGDLATVVRGKLEDQLLSCGTLSGGTNPLVDTTAAGGSTLRFDASANQFVFNWDTSGITTGPGCYALDLFLNDATQHTAFFNLQ